MKITEENIFNYVFYPETLSAELKKKIESDKGLTDAIEFYAQLKSDIEIEIPENVKDMIAQKIPAYHIAKIIKLNPVKYVYKNKKINKRLAADTESALLEPRLGTRTFADDKKDYIVRVLTDKSATKIYIFSTKAKIMENFDLIIEPPGTKYHIQNNLEPLLLNPNVDIKNIRIELD